MKQSELIVFITLYFLHTYPQNSTNSALLTTNNFNCQLRH